MKAVKPKRCARTFGKFCDIDNDDRLSRQEWINCLSKDGVNREFYTVDNTFKSHSIKYNQKRIN